MSIDLTDPTAIALLASESLHGAGLAHALYGGLALAAYGEARETRDADLAVIDPGVQAARQALEAGGLRVSISFEDVVFGGLCVGRLAVFGDVEATGLNTIDLVRPRSDRYARLVIDRSIEAPLRRRQIRIVTPEDFVILKALSTRERDLDDAASVFRRSGAAVDEAVIRREIDHLAQELPDVAVRERYAIIRQRL